ncbi:MAG: FN3 associated domain-containing protein, partial [Chitinivibrionales bacterium]
TFIVAGKHPALLVADPPTGTHFSEDTIITLITDEGARIYYTTDGSEPDTNDPGQLYSQPFVIDASTQVRAVALGDEFEPTDGRWEYIKDLPHATLEAQPGDGTRFGSELLITLTTNADEIYYTTDGSEPVPGDEQMLYDEPFTISGDTVTVRAVAVGEEFLNTSGQWVYMSERVPDIQASPSGCEFVQRIFVALQTSDPGVTIHYTTDGSEPTQNSAVYGGILEFTETTQLKARAFAADKLPSRILSEDYIRCSAAQKAYYFDSDGDGGIDSFQVEIDYPVSAGADSLILLNPFSGASIALSSDLQTVSANGTSISAAWEPGFDFSHSTSFSANDYARFAGEGFAKDHFLVEDRVAPVITAAVFSPNLLTEDMQEIGTLAVTYSEDIDGISSDVPFNFYRQNTGFSLDMELVSQSDNQAIFRVMDISGMEYLQSGDLINIHEESLTGDRLGNFQTNPDNRKVPMKVNPQPYTVVFKAGPNPFRLGQEIKAVEGLDIHTGIAIMADFQGNLGSRAQQIQARIQIYDGVHNLVCESNREGNSSSPVQYAITTDKSTKVVFLWNGQNHAGRKVGAGTYQAIVEIIDPSGNIITEDIPIGVQH